MKEKLQTVGAVVVGALKKIFTGQTKQFYRGRSLSATLAAGFSYLFRHGPVAFWRRSVHTLGEIHRRRAAGDLKLGRDVPALPSTREIKAWFEQHSQPVTIVIPSYNDYEVLKPCIESLRETVDPKSYHVLIVDDYCQKANQQKLKKLEDDDVTLIFRKQNGGFAKAVNTGLKQADKKRDVIIMNSDIVAHAGWFEALQYGAYAVADDVGIVGPKLLYPDVRIQSAGSHRGLLDPSWFDHYYRYHAVDYAPANIAQFCLGVSGAVMYIKRDTLDEIGVLDEDFGFSFEDIDYCLRAWQADMRTLYFPAASLTHFESVARQTSPTVDTKEVQAKKHFWDKWQAWFDERNVRNKQGQLRIIYVAQATGRRQWRSILRQLRDQTQTGHAPELWTFNEQLPEFEELNVRAFKNHVELIKALASEAALKVAVQREALYPVHLSSIVEGIPLQSPEALGAWLQKEV